MPLKIPFVSLLRSANFLKRILASPLRRRQVGMTRSGNILFGLRDCETCNQEGSAEKSGKDT